MPRAARDAREMFVQEFVKLRRGWGLQSPDLTRKMSPHMRQLCGISREDKAGAARDKVIATVRRLSGGFPDDLRTAVEYALAVPRGAQLPTLTLRQEKLADAQKVSLRSARRRTVEGCERLAEEAALLVERSGQGAGGPDDGWVVRRLDALLRLDTPAPELTEHRWIVARRAGLKSVVARFSLAQSLENRDTEPDVQAEVRHGASLRNRERVGEAHFVYVLELPDELGIDDEHEFSITYRVPPGYALRPYYAFTPLVPCDLFRLRVRFDPDRLPSEVWQFRGLPQRVLADRRLGGEPLALDAAGEAVLEFRQITAGYGYGIAWQPAGPEGIASDSHTPR